MLIKGHETKPKISFGLISHFARVHGFEEEKREPRGGRRGRGRRRRRRSKIRYGILFFWAFDMNPKVFGWRFVSPLV